MKKIIFLPILLVLLSANPSLLKAQTINHWETVVFDNDIWKYLVAVSEPDTNWRKMSFNDGSWLQGQGGVGYGDGDDNTIIASTVSLYLRKSFNIIDTSKIEQAVLNVDYDDAFVAYLNNVEIARANVGMVGDLPTYNQTSSGLHEALMYQGGNPDQFLINTQLLKSILLPGNNILSVQVHNGPIFNNPPLLSLSLYINVLNLNPSTFLDNSLIIKKSINEGTSI